MDVLIKRINKSNKPNKESIKRFTATSVEIEYIGYGDISVYIEREGSGFNKLCTILNEDDNNNCFSIKCGSKDMFNFEDPEEFFQKYEEYLEKIGGHGFMYELAGISIVFREEEDSEYNGIDLTTIFKPR